MNELKIFDNEEFGEIRTIDIDGEPWFVGRDVCTALEYKDSSDALKRHVEDDDKLTRCFTVSGQRRNLIVINESGLYSLIFSSKLDSAKRFKRWVTSDVLPSIRKTGNYSGKQIPAEQIPIGEVASYAKAMDRIFVRQQLSPYKIAEAFVMVSEQFGIHLPDGCVKVPEYEQLTLPIKEVQA